MASCDNYPCPNTLDDNSVTRILEIRSARVARNFAVGFCCTKCADEYYARPTPVPIAPVREKAAFDLLRKELQVAAETRRAQVDEVVEAKRQSASDKAQRELEPIELKALREAAELEIPTVGSVDGASGLFDDDVDLQVVWRNGKGDQLDTFVADTPEALNTWWQGEVSK